MVIPDLVQAFTLVTTVSAILFMFVWSLILLSYIAYHAASARHCTQPRAGCLAASPCAGLPCVLRRHSGTADAGNDTRQALLATPAWFVLLALAYRAMRQRPAK